MINQRRKPIGVRVEVLHCGNVGVDLAGDISDGMKLGAITGHTGCRILIRTNDMKVVTHGPKYRIWVISSQFGVHFGPILRPFGVHFGAIWESVSFPGGPKT